MAMAGDVLSEPLLRDRPLWHLYFLPRLEDGKLGIVFKMHHALVDGKSAVELGLLLFDADPDARPKTPEEWKPAGPPGALGLTLASLRGGAEGTVSAATAADAAGTPRAMTASPGTVRRAALALDRDLLRLAPALVPERAARAAPHPRLPPRADRRADPHQAHARRDRERRVPRSSDRSVARAGAELRRARAPAEGHGARERPHRGRAHRARQPHLVRVRGAAARAGARGVAPAAGARADGRVQVDPTGPPGSSR